MNFKLQTEEKAGNEGKGVERNLGLDLEAVEVDDIMDKSNYSNINP